MSKAHRVLRAWAVALMATVLGASSHTLAGGELPHPLIFGLATSLAACLTLLATAFTTSRTSLAVGVLTGQGVLHALYTHGSTVQMSGEGHHAHQLTVVAHSQPHSYGADMWVGHALAALATYIVLVYGEQLLEALAALAHASIRGLTPVRETGVIVTRVKAPAHFFAVRSHRHSFLLESRVTRGPPAHLAS